MNDRRKNNGRPELITDQQLQKELENGKTQEQIAHEYGYGHPSRALEDRIRSLGYDTRQRLNKNGNDYYIPPSTVNTAIEKAGLDPEDLIFFDSKVTENGKIVVEPTEQKWKKKE